MPHFKIMDSGAACSSDSLRKYKTLFLGDCIDTTIALDESIATISDFSQIKINPKTVNFKYNNVAIIPESYKIVNHSFYMRSYSYGFDVK